MESENDECLKAPGARRVRALVVENSPVAMRAVANLLAMHPLIEVAGTAWNGPEGLALAERLSPDLAFLDLEMPGMSGFDLARALRRKFAAMRLVILSTHEGTAWHQLSLERGADAFVTKHRLPGELADLVNRLFPDAASRPSPATDPTDAI